MVLGPLKAKSLQSQKRANKACSHYAALWRLEGLRFERQERRRTLLPAAVHARANPHARQVKSADHQLVCNVTITSEVTVTLTPTIRHGPTTGIHPTYRHVLDPGRHWAAVGVLRLVSGQ